MPQVSRIDVIVAAKNCQLIQLECVVSMTLQNLFTLSNEISLKVHVHQSSTDMQCILCTVVLLRKK